MEKKSALSGAMVTVQTTGESYTLNITCHYNMANARIICS